MTVNGKMVDLLRKRIYNKHKIRKSGKIFMTSDEKGWRLMLFERLNDRKKELGLTTEKLSQLSGVPVGTINKILSGGDTCSPI